MTRVLSILALVVLAGASPAAATIVTVQVSGTWTSVDDPQNALDGSVGIGTGFSATLTYDDTTADLDSGPEYGTYTLSPADLAIVAGGYQFAMSDSGHLHVDNDLVGADTIYLIHDAFGNNSGPLPPGVEFRSTFQNHVNLNLFFSSQDALGSDALVGLDWTADRNFGEFALNVPLTGFPGYFEIHGTITEIQVVPEPSLLVLGFVSCAALKAARRRSRHTRSGRERLEGE